MISFDRIKAVWLNGVLLLSCVLVPSMTAAQDALISGVAITEDDAAAQIEEAIAVVEARQGLDADTRASVIVFLRDAETQLQNKLTADAAAEQFVKALDTAPAETVALRAVLDRQPSAPATKESLGVDETTSLAELQQSLAKETAELTAVNSELAEFRSQVETQVSRRALVTERIAELQRSREAAAANVDNQAVAGEQTIVTNARKLDAQIRRAAQGAEINRLEQELLSYTVRLDLLRAKRDVAARSQVSLQQRAELLRTVANERQQADEAQAQQAAIAAELESVDKHPVVRSLAEDNVALAVMLPTGAADILSASEELAEMKRITKGVEQRIARSSQHIEVGGLSRITGRLLMEERKSLPQLNRYRPRDTEIAEVGLALMFLQEQRRELTSLDGKTQELMEEVSADVSDEEEFAAIRNEVRVLLRSRQELLIHSESSYRSYLQVLGDLDKEQRRLMDSAAEYEEFLNKNLLWIPSAPVAFTESSVDLTTTLNWVISPDSWRLTFVVLRQSLREHLVAVAIYLILLGSLLVARRPLASTYKSMSAKVGRLSTDNIGLTLGSLAIAAERVLPVPAVLAGVAWFLVNAPHATAFSDTIAYSLSATAPFLFNTLLFRILCAPRGVFSTHFRWSAESLFVIRRQLGRLAIIGAPLVFTTVLMFDSEDAGNHTDSGRLSFVILMVFLSFIIRPIVHPVSGPARDYYRNWPLSWISSFRWIWYFTAVGIPLLLGLISILGNVYTSTIMAGLLVRTVWLVLGLVIVNMVILRWLALSRRKLELKILLQKREAQRAEREAAEQPNAEADAVAVSAEPLDLDAVDQQSRVLLRTGLLFVASIAVWRVWSEVIPALTLLNGISLWSQIVMVDGVETIAPVTLADLILALLVILVSAIASRNLPGFIEIAIPQRLNVAPGSRYAIITLIRYLIILVGVVVVLNVLGWNWSRIQWLVAALSVGLGFGLQEIVANFVAGIVILFERPIRVGDTITVGQLTGTVTRIRIRATTIVDWDRKEIIVPNKSFITEQVVNWTLSDPITRMVIPVGVSYGSDVGLVHKVISETLQKLSLVPDEPEPQVYFKGFGESSLDFVLHVYLRQMTDRMPLVHEVHNGVLRALRENGIEIPFPQRDLHIRSTVEQE